MPIDDLLERADAAREDGRVQEAADTAPAQQFLGVFAGSVAVSELFPTPEPAAGRTS